MVHEIENTLYTTLTSENVRLYLFDTFGSIDRISKNLCANIKLFNRVVKLPWLAFPKLFPPFLGYFGITGKLTSHYQDIHFPANGIVRVGDDTTADMGYYAPLILPFLFITFLYNNRVMK